MELIINQHDNITLVVLEGRFDATGVEEMEVPFAEATSDKSLPVVVDMSGITFMSSLGIGFLFANSKKLKKAGTKLILLNPKGMVEAVLRTSKMDRVMPIANDLAEALQILGIQSITLKTSAAKPESATVPGKETAKSTEGAVKGLKLAIKNELTELKDLYATVEEFLGKHSTPYRSGYAVNLAVEELVVNIIRYAYMDFDEHLIDIELNIEEEQLVLVIEDDGRPFDPREGKPASAEPEPEDPEDAEVGGLGLILVLDIVDLMKYSRVNNKNRTEIRVHIVADADAEVSA